MALNNDTETWVENVQIGTGALVYWVDSPGYGAGNHPGNQTRWHGSHGMFAVRGIVGIVGQRTAGGRAGFVRIIGAGVAG